jgi:phospholipid transport system transporter-binding protein
MPFLLPSKVTQEHVVQLESDGLLNELTLRTVDCSALRDFDSMVLTVLIAWQKKLLLKGESIAIVNAPEKLKVLAGLYGVSQLLGLV